MLRTKLKGWLSWQPQPTELLTRMRPVKPWPVQMERYSRGIDNTHIDVYLSSQYLNHASTLVGAMVRHDISKQYWGDSQPQPSADDQQAFRDAYRGLVEGAKHHKEELTEADWVRLVQLSLLKHLLLLVPEAIQERREHLEKQRESNDSQETGRRLEYHERLVVLAREEHAIAYRVYRRLFRLVEKLETAQLRKVRKSGMGASWPLPRDAMFNPLLQLPNLLAESDVMHHYPVLCIEEKGREYLDALNHCIADVFKDYLPTWTRPVDERHDEEADMGSGTRFHVIDRLDQGGLRGFLETEIVLRQLLFEEEYKKPQYSWLDDPDNLEQLLGEQKIPHGQGPDSERIAKNWRYFRRGVTEELYRRVEKLDIMPRIVASYWTPRIHQELNGKVSARMIYEYLTGQQDKRKVLRRLAASQAEVDPSMVAKTLEFAAAEIRQLTRESRREYAIRMLIDFLRLRRDLKLAYKTFEAMDQIRILIDEDDINLSRTNGLLYAFKLDDDQTANQQVRSHVILKADLRGSTRITSELKAKKLNPATHFSQNFFNPINEFLSDFDARKVFVEGDAVILSFMEYVGSRGRRQCVSLACGMAMRILEVVNKQNVLNRRYGLPELELGLGIAYCDEDPAFLYDEDRQIMISPAINLADRLSSCAAVLRKGKFSASGRPFRVEVLTPARQADLPAESKTDVLRFNVNGIELDTEAFAKLKGELVLHRIDLKVEGRHERFHVGRYPDRTDRMNWLIVREATMLIWQDGDISGRQDAHRRFYEVVVDQKMITLIRSKLRSGREEKTTVPGEAPRLSPFAAKG